MDTRIVGNDPDRSRNFVIKADGQEQRFGNGWSYVLKVMKAPAGIQKELRGIAFERDATQTEFSGCGAANVLIKTSHQVSPAKHFSIAVENAQSSGTSVAKFKSGTEQAINQLGRILGHDPCQLV